MSGEAIDTRTRSIAGGDDYIAKPYSPRQLLAKVNEDLR
jgi:DNA-binding response OmpR family regulator